MSKCLSCGAFLQTTDEDKEGYILAQVFDKKICMRCYKLQHYGTFKMARVMPNDKIISHINKESDLTFFLVDLLNINSEVLTTFKKIKQPKILIISKTDYIPQDIKYEKITNWLKTEYAIIEPIIYLSSKKNYNVQAIEKKVLECKAHKVFLSGYTNAGKSSLINILQEEANLTVSYLPNTTLGFVELKGKYYTLIDSPGFNYENTLYRVNEAEFMKKMTPKTYLRPITYQLKPEASLIIEDKIRLENGNNNLNVVCYFSNLLSLKKVYAKNNHLKDMPEVKLTLKNNQDLVIKGLGFINIKGSGDLKVYQKDPRLIEIRESFF